MEHLFLLLLGIALSAIGVMNIRGNINTVHAYNRRRIKPEDIPAYGKTIGAGTLVIGVALLLAFVLALWREDLISYAAAPGLVIGLAIILFGQFKYNHGLF